MLAAGAHHFLGGGDTWKERFFSAGENILKLVHACIGKHEGGVIFRHQR